MRGQHLHDDARPNQLADGAVVTLLPSLDVCLARNTARARDPFLADADLRANYDDFAECVALHPPEHLFDTSTLTVDQVVQRIQIILDERTSAT